MSPNQLGMVFQIAGFVLAAVFAGILLERGVLGIWRGKGEAWFVSMTSALERVTFTLGRTQTGGIAMQIPGEQRLSSIRVRSFGGMLLYAIIFASPAVGTGCIIAGHLVELTWLFWTGVSFLSLFALAILGEILNNRRHAYTQVDLKRNMLQELKTDDQIETSSPEEESLSRHELPVLLPSIVHTCISFDANVVLCASNSALSVSRSSTRWTVSGRIIKRQGFYQKSAHNNRYCHAPCWYHT